MRPSIFSFTITLFVFQLFMSFGVYAQSRMQKVWIVFRDKGESERNFSLNKSDLLKTAREIGLSEKAIERRRKVLAENEIITQEDLPIAQSYIDAIERRGMKVISISRWMNAVSVYATDEQLKELSSISFIKNITPVRTWSVRNKEYIDPVFQPLPSLRKTTGYGLDYGLSLQQNEMMQVPRVHDIWIDGTGVLAGMNDNGFRWRVHEAMKKMKVLREYDFINKDSLTENENNDTPGQDGHGTLTMSTLGGFKEGALIGPSFNASFELAKTEYNPTETKIEEDYWVEGIEWHERNGADLVSSSLGYNTFDDSTGYYFSNGDFDGKHAITSVAAARAARFGVVVVNSMGNEGNKVGSIIAPADADSIISVGAVDSTGRLAGFSSIGPTNDGRTKPDVCARGVGVVCATRDGEATYTRASGTSLSCPLTAGVVGLVLSARPELTPLQVRDAVRNTASQASNPDNLKGWGVVDAWEAVLYHGMVISSNPKIFWTGKENKIAAYVVSKNTVDIPSVTLWYTVEVTGYVPIKMTLMTPYAGMGAGSGLYVAALPRFAVGQVLRFYISAADAKENRTVPFNAPTKYFLMRIGDSSTTGATRLFPNEFALLQNYPNPVSLRSESPSYTTTITYKLPTETNVKLEVFDRLGRRVAVLKDGFEASGTYDVTFDASSLASGVYFYRLSAYGESVTKRMVVMR